MDLKSLVIMISVVNVSLRFALPSVSRISYARTTKDLEIINSPFLEMKAKAWVQHAKECLIFCDFKLLGFKALAKFDQTSGKCDCFEAQILYYFGEQDELPAVLYYFDASLLSQDDPGPPPITEVAQLELDYQEKTQPERLEILIVLENIQLIDSFKFCLDDIERDSEFCNQTDTNENSPLEYVLSFPSLAPGSFYQPSIEFFKDDQLLGEKRNFWRVFETFPRKPHLSIFSNSTSSLSVHWTVDSGDSLNQVMLISLDPDGGSSCSTAIPCSAPIGDGMFVVSELQSEEIYEVKGRLMSNYTLSSEDNWQLVGEWSDSIWYFHQDIYSVQYQNSTEVPCRIITVANITINAAITSVQFYEYIDNSYPVGSEVTHLQQSLTSKVGTNYALVKDPSLAAETTNLYWITARYENTESPFYLFQLKSVPDNNGGVTEVTFCASTGYQDGNSLTTLEIEFKKDGVSCKSNDFNRQSETTLCNTLNCDSFLCPWFTFTENMVLALDSNSPNHKWEVENTFEFIVGELKYTFPVGQRAFTVSDSPFTYQFLESDVQIISSS